MRAPDPPTAPLAACALALATLVSPLDSHANGLISHVYLADQAVPSLPAGPLRDIMSDPALRSAYQNGAVFPDTGYGAGHAYGEWSHWESFLEGYLAILRERYGRDYSAPEARRLVAFGMGVAAHVLADQVFDILFMARVRELDGNTDNLDIGSDSWLVWEHNEPRTVDGVLPEETILAVYPRRMGPATTAADLRRGVEQVQTGMRAVNALSRSWYPQYWREYRWGAAHYLNPQVPGSFPYVARSIAAYWRVLWDRLQGTASPARSVLATEPRDGAENVGVDRASVTSRFAGFLGYGVDPASVRPEALVLLAPDGTEVPRNVRVYSSDLYGNTLLIEPRADLAYDTRYRVELRSSLRFVTGETLGTNLAFSFRTRCAPGRESDCPPLPAPFVPAATPPGRDAGAPRDAGAMIDASGGDDGVRTERDAGVDGAVSLPPSAGAAGCGCRVSVATPRGANARGAAWLAAAGALAATWRKSRRTRH